MRDAISVCSLLAFIFSFVFRSLRGLRVLSFIAAAWLLFTVGASHASEVDYSAGAGIIIKATFAGNSCSAFVTALTAATAAYAKAQTGYTPASNWAFTAPCMAPNSSQNYVAVDTLPSSGSFTLGMHNPGNGFDYGQQTMTIVNMDGVAPVCVPPLVLNAAGTACETPAPAGGTGTVGAVMSLLVCVPYSGASSVSPCIDVNGSHTQPAVVQSFVVDPSQASNFAAASVPFDYGVATQFFTFGFTGVASIFLVSYCLGIVVGIVKNH